MKMSTFSNTFESLNLFKPIQLLKEIEIKKNFGKLLNTEFNIFHLCLYRFSDRRPLKYFNRTLIIQLYNFLESYYENFRNSIIETEDVLNESFWGLLRTGSSWEKEYNLDISTPKNIEEFETIWHPEYVRYFESIYKKLLQPIIRTIDKNEKTNLTKTNEKNQTEKLKKLGFDELLKGNNRTIRNAISHGKVSYDYTQIIYNDTNTRESLFPSDFLRIFDYLVETCNSIAITYILVFSEIFTSDSSIVRKLPLCFKFMFIDGLLSSEYFQMLSFYESTVNKKPQLNVICKLKSSNRLTQTFYSLNLCYYIHKYIDRNFSRFAISLECGKPIASSIFINGNKLHDAIVYNQSIDASKDIIETNLLWYNTSNFKRRIENWKHIIKIQYRIYKIERQKELREVGFKLFKKRFEIKEIENRSTDKIVRIYVFVLIKDIAGLDEYNFHKLVKHIISILRKKRFHCKRMGESTLFRKHPKYIWLDLYSQDKSLRFYKRHMYESFHILKAEWINNSKRMTPIFLKNPDAIIEKVRFKYNRKSDILKISKYKLLN